MSAKRKPSSLVTRKRSGATLRRTTIYLPEDVARAVRRRCVDEDVTLSDVVTELARQWVQPTIPASSAVSMMLSQCRATLALLETGAPQLSGGLLGTLTRLRAQLRTVLRLAGRTVRD